MGRDVTVVDGRDSDDEFFPKGPSSVCFEGPPQQQCYATREPTRNADVSLVQVKKDLPAVLFSSDIGGVSGWTVTICLLRPVEGKELQDLFSSIKVSNQNQHAFWNEPSISEAQIFLTADYVWGPDEGHDGEHRYIVSAYALNSREERYFLDDRYMTIRKYDLDANVDILAAEKPEILERLKTAAPEISVVSLLANCLAWP